MIALSSDCLLFELANGANLPLSANNICIDLLGEQSAHFDAEFVQHAANAVFHYFKHDLGRQSVSMAEFAEALENVLRGFNVATAPVNPPPARTSPVAEADLYRLACESGEGSELFFFPRLRDELRRHLKAHPQLLRFNKLRPCVKTLAGARRWNPRCSALEAEIVEFLRECLSAEQTGHNLALVVR